MNKNNSEIKLSEELIVSNLLNLRCSLYDIDLDTDIRDVFGYNLAAKLAEFLAPDYIANRDAYTLDDFKLGNIFKTTPLELLRWHSDSFPLGFWNTEIDIIEAVLYAVMLNDDRVSNTRFFGEPFRNKYKH